jgi:hypothetical protein
VVSVPLASSSTRYCTTQTSFYDSKDFQGTSIRLQFWAAKGKRVTEFWEWTEWLLARTHSTCVRSPAYLARTQSQGASLAKKLYSALGGPRLSVPHLAVTEFHNSSTAWVQAFYGHVQGAINLDWLGPANYSRSSPPEQTLSGFIPPPTLSTTGKLQDSNMEYLWGETS